MSIKTAIAVSALALLAGCASTPQKADITGVEKFSHQVTPDTLLARGYYDQAATAYRAALTTNPEDAVARYGVAEAQRLGGKYDAAAEDYQLLTANPEWNARALEGLGRTSLAKGDRLSAFDRFSAVVSMDPTAWRSWLALAQLQDLTQSWAKADEAYALALSNTKEPAIVHNNHGVSMMARGEPAAAIGLFRSALAADPKLARANVNLELAQAATGQNAVLDSSEGDARERARKLNNYGYVAEMQNRDADAQRYYEAALKEHPSFYALAFNNLKSLQSTEDKPKQ